MVLFDDFWGMHIVDWFPGVIARWVALPLDEVLQGLTSSEGSMIDDCFHFELLVSLHKVGGGPREVGTV